MKPTPLAAHPWLPGFRLVLDQCFASKVEVYDN